MLAIGITGTQTWSSRSVKCQVPSVKMDPALNPKQSSAPGSLIAVSTSQRARLRT